MVKKHLLMIIIGGFRRRGKQLLKTVKFSFGRLDSKIPIDLMNEADKLKVPKVNPDLTTIH